MNWLTDSGDYTPPVKCPQCGESQNRFSGRTVSGVDGFEKVDCMVCGRVFNAEEYQGLAAEARLKPVPPIARPV